MTKITIELSGGLELLFGGQKEHQVDVTPAQYAQDHDHVLTMAELLPWVRDNLLKERPELFLKENSVRPGILVLINETDWELCGTADATLSDGDCVHFISTLHGG